MPEKTITRRTPWRLLTPSIALALCGLSPLLSQSTAKQTVVPLPPMGWSSWNSFSNTVDSQVVMNQTKAMVASGMQKAGYQYINIDEGWWLGARDTAGNIVVEPKAWPAIAASEKPGDMSNIVRYIHGAGLKAGIYTDAGRDGCSTVGPDLGPSYPGTGSEGHYEQDFLQFAKWGFDYVKVDWCGGDKENLDPAVQYAEIARAIARAEVATGHRLYYSICNWGKHSPSTWAPNIGGVVADIWRTGGDIVDPIVANTKNAGRKAAFKEVLREYDQAQHPEAQHTGFFNDPDMMVVGMPGLSDQQNRAHMSLWAMSGGPLLVGADLTRLSTADVATLTNADVLAVDQDGLGLQAVKVTDSGPGLEVWAKPLAKSGERAVLLLNRTGAAAQVQVRWSDLGLLDSPGLKVKDVWSGKEMGSVATSSTTNVEAGDVVMLLVRGTESPVTTYKPIHENGESIFRNVVSKTALPRIWITYSNADKLGHSSELRVNGRTATRIHFAPTGEKAQGIVSIEAPLELNLPNALTFAPVGISVVTISSIALR